MNTLSSLLNFIGNNIKNYSIEMKRTSSATTVNAYEYKAIDIDVSKSGYTPIGVLEILKEGSASGYCAISNYYFSGNKTNLAIGVINASSNTASVTMGATVLYQKLGGVIRSIFNVFRPFTLGKGVA